MKTKLTLSDALSEVARMLRELEVSFEADQCFAIKIRADGTGQVQYNLPDSSWEIDLSPEIDEFQEEFSSPTEVGVVLEAVIEDIMTDKAEQERLDFEDGTDLKNDEDLGMFQDQLYRDE